MQTFLTDLQASYPDMSSLVNVGTTIEGRAITGIVISGDSDPNGTKNKIVINGCQHARFVLYNVFGSLLIIIC